MAVLDWDTVVGIIPDSAEFGITFNNLVNISPLTGNVQTMHLPGARWRMRISFKNLTPDDSRKLISFLVSLRGSHGRFYCYDFGHPTPRGNISGSIRVRSTQSKSVITLEDSSTLLTIPDSSFEIGDYISIGSDTDRELKMITAINGSGQFTIEPNLIKKADTGLYNTVPVNYNKPTAVFMLSSDQQAQWSTRAKAYLTDIDIDAVQIDLPAGA